MPQFMFEAYDWEAFNQLFDDGDSELVRALIENFERGSEFQFLVSSFPKDTKAYPKALRSFLASDDWYQGATNDDSRSIAELLSYVEANGLRARRKKARFPVSLKLKRGTKLGECSIMADWTWELAKGLDGYTDSGADATAARLRFEHFAAWPFRHPKYDPAKAYASHRKRVNAGHDDYFHAYAVHPPEAVAIMHTWLEEVADLFNEQHDPSGGPFSILGDLREVLKQAADKQAGLYVTQDY